MLELFSYSLSSNDIAVLLLAAILIGMTKTGVAGAGMIAVPMLAISFGGKESSGLMLPILLFADVFGVRHYHRHANWQHLSKLLPFAIIGVVIGTVIGNAIDDAMFRIIMAIIIFASLTLMFWLEQSKNPTIPDSVWFVAAIGIVGGFTTMVGNLAGPVMALYLLAMRFPKNQFIGTAAWFFFATNLLKVPFHVFVWETITVESFLLDLMLIPAIAFGAFSGIWIIKRVNEKLFRWLVITMTAVSAIAMLA